MWFIYCTVNANASYMHHVNANADRGTAGLGELPYLLAESTHPYWCWSHLIYRCPSSEKLLPHSPTRRVPSKALQLSACIIISWDKGCYLQVSSAGFPGRAGGREVHQPEGWRRQDPSHQAQQEGWVYWSHTSSFNTVIHHLCHYSLIEMTVYLYGIYYSN